MGELSSEPWIFSEEEFQSWYDSDAPGGRMLCIGSLCDMGKTVLIPTVISKLLAEKQPLDGETAVAYFYASHDFQEPHNVLLRTLLDQLINQKPTLSDELFGKYLNMHSEEIGETYILQKLVKQAIETYRVTFLVLDGLDECVKHETAQTIEWLLSMMVPNGPALRIMISARDDGNSPDVSLNSNMSILLERPAHYTEDIRRYCISRGQEMEEGLGLDQDMWSLIANMVAEGSKGSFLCARVLVDHAFDTAMSPGTMETSTWWNGFPQDIQGLCRLGMSHLRTKPTSPGGLQLLGLVLAAARPLRWSEVQAWFCTDATNSMINYSSLGQSTQGKQHCGGLVDVWHPISNDSCSEEMIGIASAEMQKFLSEEPGMVNMGLEHAKLSRFCSAYLTSTRFREGVYPERITTWEDADYYELLDYTVQNWYRHAKVAVDAYSTAQEPEFGQAIGLLGRFLWAYLKETPYWDGKTCPTEHQEVVELFRHIPEDARERNSQSRLESQTRLIRCGFFHLTRYFTVALILGLVTITLKLKHTY